MKSPTDRQLNTLLHELLARLHASEYGEVYLSPSHFPAWDEQAISIFQKSGLLKETTPLSGACCNGCERGCFAPVEIEAATPTHPARAFIICEERDDMGLVPVPFDHLRQWWMGLETLAELIADYANTDQKPHTTIQGRLCFLGRALIGRKRRALFLAHNMAWGELSEVAIFKAHVQPVILTISSFTAPQAASHVDMTTLLYVANGKIELDREALHHAVTAFASLGNEGFTIHFERYARQLLLNDQYILSRPQIDEENARVMEFLCMNPNRAISQVEIEKTCGILSKTLHQIVSRLGFTGKRKTAFFTVQKNDVQFFNPVTLERLKSLSIKPNDITKDLESL